MTGWTRREFLGLTATACSGWAKAADLTRDLPARATAHACIVLNMVGGPSHLETFDPKPDARSDYRGPFQPIASRVPGIHLSELLPRLAQWADRFALIRGLCYDGPAVHEVGQGWLNSGRWQIGTPWPHYAAVAHQLLGPRQPATPSWVVLPSPALHLGLACWDGQTAAGLGQNAMPGEGAMPGREDAPSPSALADAGPAALADLCRRAIDLVEAGRHRVVVINQFTTLFAGPTWDCHASYAPLSTTLADYRQRVAPAFDAALSALLEGLESRGLLGETLVVAAGEFGRTPWLNSQGGRDHWPRAGSALLAGGGIAGGQALGRTDADGAEVVDRPVSPAELVATILYALGVPPGGMFPGPTGSLVPAYPARPIFELF